MISFYKKHIKKRNKGFSLVEVLFYISVLAVLSLVVINSLIVMTNAFRETTINRDFMQARNIIERISRDIRRSTGIIATQVSADSLKLIIESDSEVYDSVEFVLVGKDIQVLENDKFVGNLNSPHLSISNLNFYIIDTTAGMAVKFSFTAGSNNTFSKRTEDFYDTVVLRGAY